MIVTKRTYLELKETFDTRKKSDETMIDELKARVKELTDEVSTLKSAIKSLDYSNITPYSKIKSGSLVLNSKGELREVLNIQGNWVLNCNTDRSHLSVITPAVFDTRFKIGPVSKQDLIKYMKDNGYSNL